VGLPSRWASFGRLAAKEQEETAAGKPRAKPQLTGGGKWLFVLSSAGCGDGLRERPSSAFLFHELSDQA
jgi:hypothetical protein